jgi:hypothetical protein
MEDLVFIALVIAFFATATGAVYLCDRIVRAGEAPAVPVPSAPVDELVR